jgi:hypothetical protein
VTGPAATAAVVLALVLQPSGAPKFESNRAWEHLRQIVALGPRPAGSAALEQTRTYIKSQLASAGVQVREQRWNAQTPLGTLPMVNVIATIPGARPERIIVAGHYDTKLFREFRFVGANDGGSSAAFLIELARALKGTRQPMTIEVLFLDGEESTGEWRGTDHTYGSRHYVEAARRDGSLAGAKALVLVDMIADRQLLIKRDNNSTRWLTTIIWNEARRLKLEDYFSPLTTSIEDDHLEFLAGGIPSVDLIDLEYEPWHTAQDTLDAVSARSMQVVGDVVLAALPKIQARFQ